MFPSETTGYHCIFLLFVPEIRSESKTLTYRIFSDIQIGTSIFKSSEKNGRSKIGCGCFLFVWFERLSRKESKRVGLVSSAAVSGFFSFAFAVAALAAVLKRR